MPREVKPEDCEKVKNRVAPLLETDTVWSERDLREKAEEKLRGRRREERLKYIKLPDCTWHYANCRYGVAELKGVNFQRAMRQLESFAKFFPEIHADVEHYIVRLTGTSQLRGFGCDPVGGRRDYCRPYIKRGKVKQYVDVLGKPVYILIERKRRK